ncbi:hypothetical protein ACHAPT_013614 [Fusarium lateritium]
MATIKVGIVGYGFAAKNFHIPFISANPDYQIVAILQRAEAPSDPTSVTPGSHCTVDFPGIKHYRTAEDFFADSEIAFVVVATHTDTHASFAERALQSGKHVIVDKPFARSAEEADQTMGTHSIDQAVVLFGRPKSVTGFLRAQRGIESEIEDSFTIILQYEGEQKNLLVTVKTSVTTPLAQQLKFLVRGTEGSYIKWQQRSTCPQEEQIQKGVQPLDPDFGKEPEALQGTLTTYKVFDERYQKLDPETNKYTGRYPTITGRWIGIYENVANAINGKEELAVKATQSRDAIRVIELARESHEKEATISWR